MIRTDGKAYETDHGKTVIVTSRPGVDNLSDDVTVIWHDNRLRSNEQIRKAFALMNDIGEYQGQTSEDVYQEQRLAFSKKFMDELNGMFFHLSVATMSEASTFINFLIELIIANDIPTKKPLFQMADDIERYVYACLVNKKCCVCGKKADLHHVDAIGMGFNRETKPQLGALVLPLCRVHHGEWHDLGIVEFDKKYHIILQSKSKTRCRHWWIDCGRQKHGKRYMTEYRCDICGEVGFVPVGNEKEPKKGLPHGKHTLSVRG